MKPETQNEPISTGEGWQRYQIIPRIVEARRVTAEGGETIQHSHRGLIRVRQGDWVIRLSDGKFWITSDEGFRECYERIIDK